jgi:hypothetical protein
MSRTDQLPVASGTGRPPVLDDTPPTPSRVAGILAAVACAVGCALPLLIGAGVLTAAGAALLQKTLLAVTAALVVAGLGMWWGHRRRDARRAGG